MNTLPNELVFVILKNIKIDLLMLVCKKWISACQYIKFKPDEINEAFKLCCFSDDLMNAKKVYTNFKLYEYISNDYIYDILNQICQYGHLQVAKWLHSFVVLNASQIDNILIDGCLHGHFGIVKWITTTYKLVDIDESEMNYYLICCYMNGHLKIAKWLIKYTHFSITYLGKKGHKKYKVWKDIL